MPLIILDFGSGGTCHGDLAEGQRMIDGLAEVDRGRIAVIKWQLWDKGTEPQCARLDWRLYRDLADYAARLGFRTTASVFDKPSLDYLLTLDPPFVKLANRPYLRHLARYVPRGIPIIASHNVQEWVWDLEPPDARWIYCVSKYPARIDEYTSYSDVENRLVGGVSDHTVGLDLWRRYRPAVYEKHFALETSTGPDAGPWCITPAALGEVLNG